MWATEGVKATGASGTILADTGALSGGQSNYSIIISSTAALVLTLANRNAANNADLNTHVIPAQIGLTPPIILPIDVEPGGRIVVRTNAAIASAVQVAILRE